MAAGALTTCAILVAGAWMRPTIFARSSSSDGKAASALTPFGSSAVLPIAPPRITNCSWVLAKSTATFGAATGSPEKAIRVGPLSRERDRGDVGAFKSDLGEAILRDLHGGARLLHLPTQSLHLGDREAGIVSNDDDVGGLEDLAKARDLLSFCRAFHQLSPVGGPLLTEAAGLMPAVPPTARRRQDDVPAPRRRLALHRAIEVRTEGQLPREPLAHRSSPVYAGLLRELSRFRRLQSRTGSAVRRRNGTRSRSLSSALLGNPRRIGSKRGCSLLWFSRNAQRRADKPGRHAHGRYLDAPRRLCQAWIRATFRRTLCRGTLAA